MSSTLCTTCAPASVLPTYRPAPLRWWHELQSAWAEWRERVRDEEALRSLAHLSPETLHDIGLAERVQQRPTLSLADYERGRW